MHHYLLAAFCAVLSNFFISISMTIAKFLSQDLHTQTIVFIRSLFGFIFVIPFIVWYRADVQKPYNIKLYCARVILTIATMLCTYYSYRKLPVYFATTLGMSGALFVTVLSIIFLKDKVNKTQAFFIILGYFGVLLVIKPESFILEFPTLILLLANFTVSFVIIITKVISRVNNIISIVLYSNFGITLLSFIIGFANNNLMLPNMKDCFLLSLNALLGVAAQFCSITAVKYATPSFIAPLEYSRLMFGIIIGSIFFSEVVDLYTIIGGIIIVGSNSIIVYLKNNKSSEI